MNNSYQKTRNCGFFDIIQRMKKLSFLVIFSIVFILFATTVSASELPNAAAIISLVNIQRVTNGLPALIESQSLDQSALLKAQSLVGQGALIHTQSVSGALWWPLAQVGYDYDQMGENLAANYSDANVLVSDWMVSPEHRVNILDTRVKDIGVAIVAGDYQGSPSDYIVEYTGLLKPQVTFAINQGSNIVANGMQGATITVQASGVISRDNTQVEALLQEIISLLRQIILAKQSHYIL
jgi:uncharacterized protein YkwD